MRKYKQLTHKERYQIYALIKEGLNYTQIAKNIGINKSTVSREIKRNSKCKSTYHPDSASIESFARHKFKNKSVKITSTIEKYIRKYLKVDWSPEQIAGRLKEDKIVNISHEAIYQYIYRNKASGGRLYLHLPYKMKKYKNRSGSYSSRGIIIDRVPISKRPNIVDKKQRIGDFEVDTIVGKYHKGSIVSIVDRKSKFTILRKLPSKEAIQVSNAITELLYPIRKITHTITSDNGKEFAYHKTISQALNTQFYFCDPYSSWQRGLNENTNGLVRRYIPKRTDFDEVSNEEIQMIQYRLNHRPRKALGYKTPHEVFMKEVSRKLVA